MNSRRALVVGLGVGGMSAALGLRQAGWTPVIVEKAPERRTGGYYMGLQGSGQEAAAELDVRNNIHTRTPHEASLWEVDSDGPQRTVGLPTDQPGGPETVLRGDIEAGLWEAIDGNVEVRFGTTPTAITQQPDSATVTLEDTASGETTEETFDLVIGADGLRSTVRSLVFGPHEEFMHSWDAIICAFQLDEQIPGYEEHDGLVTSEAGRALWVFPFADRPPTGLFTYRTADVDAQFTGDRVETLREVYAGMDNDAVRYALDALADTQEFLFDSVHSVKMRRWSSGRVVLLGDSAWCLTLFSGMGGSAGLHGGAELGKALQERPDDVESALKLWERRMRPFIAKERLPTRLKHEMFVPSNRVGKYLRSLILSARDIVTRLSSNPVTAADSG